MRRSVLACTVALMALSGCGGDEEPASTGDVVATVDVSLTDFALEPPNPVIERPGTVRFNATNDGQAEHSIEVEGPGGEAELESPLASGETGSVDVDLSEPGTYVWYCPVGDHQQRGMRGQIKVGTGTASTVTETTTQTAPTETETTETETETTETETETSETETSEGGGGIY